MTCFIYDAKDEVGHAGNNDEERSRRSQIARNKFHKNELGYGMVY